MTERGAPLPRRRVHHLVFGVGAGISGTVYGTILVMAALDAGSAGEIPPGRLTVVVSATVLVVWIAHVYAHALGESVERRRRVDLAELRAIAARELPIPLAAVAPVAVLLLSALGVLREATAVWVAFGVCLATLAFQGFRYASVEHLGRARTAVSVAANLALGLLVVALKVIVSH